MKTVTTIMFAVFFSLLAACGDMSNNTNEDHSHEIDSSGMNTEDAGNPNASNAPLRNVYDTDTMNNTVGPDNAAPKSSATDSTTQAKGRVI